MVPKAGRATGYGIFECSFGIFWFLGSWLMGVLYDVSIPAMVAISVLAQLSFHPTLPLVVQGRWAEGPALTEDVRSPRVLPVAVPVGGVAFFM